MKREKTKRDKLAHLEIKEIISLKKELGEKELREKFNLSLSGLIHCLKTKGIEREMAWKHKGRYV